MAKLDLLTEIGPELQAAYDRHMMEGRRQPLYSPEILARAAGTKALDPLVYGPILREKAQGHFGQFMQDGEGVDILTPLADSFYIGDATEANLPYYTHANMSLAGTENPLAEFVHEWTAEEKSHETIMTDLGTLTGIIGRDDMITHEAFKAMLAKQLRTGTEIHPESLNHAFAYLSLQELLTEKAHNMTGWLLGRDIGKPTMGPITGQEHTHYVFYLAASKAAIEVDPEQFVISLWDVYRDFAMPGEGGIPHFATMSKRIAIAGIFDPVTVVDAKAQIVNELGIADIQLDSDEAKAAQTELLESVSTNNRDRKQKTLDKYRDRIITRHEGRLRPFIIGETVELVYSGGDEVNGHRIPKRPVGIMPITA